MQRRQISNFLLTALEGHYEAVYLDEVKRSVDGDQISYAYVNNIIPRGRYGKTTREDIRLIRDMFATNDEFKNDEEFKDARVVEGYHYFAKDEPSRKNVESENIRRTFLFADTHHESVVHLELRHIPNSRAHNLQQISGKQFEGVLSNFVACKGMPIMILSNLAPQFGLFNGSLLAFSKSSSKSIPF